MKRLFLFEDTFKIETVSDIEINNSSTYILNSVVVFLSLEEMK